MMHKKFLAAATAAIVAAAPLAVATAPTHAATSTATPERPEVIAERTPPVAQVPISFRVRNVNRSDVPCASNGRTYTVRGHVVGPARKLQRSRLGNTTLYLHGLSFGEFFYRFQKLNGFDYAADQARRGQVSVVIDRLGYGRSDKLNGSQICVGSRADMAHQMVTKLRSGQYRSAAGRPPRFDKVVLAGHSYGGQIAQVAAYSFGDIAGLVVLGYSDRVQSRLLASNARFAARVCARGGREVGGKPGYAPFGPPDGAGAALFRSAATRVKRAVLREVNIDPCGDTASFPTATEVDLQRLGSVRVPVLVVGGGSDKLFPRPAAADQAELFTGSRSVHHRTLRGTAHAFTFRAQARHVGAGGGPLAEPARPALSHC